MDYSANRTKSAMLGLEITITVWKIGKLERICNDIKSKLQNVLPASLFEDIKIRVLDKYEVAFKNIRQKDRRKLRSLRGDTAPVMVSTHQETAIFNFTPVSLPDEVKQVLWSPSSVWK